MHRLQHLRIARRADESLVLRMLAGREHRVGPGQLEELGKFAHSGLEVRDEGFVADFARRAGCNNADCWYQKSNVRRYASAKVGTSRQCHANSGRKMLHEAADQHVAGMPDGEDRPSDAETAVRSPAAAGC